MKNHKIPEISILRASNGAFDGILIDPDASSLAASALDSAPAASANDCTGISVTVPQTHDEAEALTKVERRQRKQQLPPRHPRKITFNIIYRRGTSAPVFRRPK